MANTPDSKKAPQPTDTRLARVLLPARLLREVDEIVGSGAGGYGTRQEFFHEAIQNQVLEVRHGTSEGGQLTISPGLASGADHQLEDAHSDSHGTTAAAIVVSDLNAAEVDAPTLPTALLEGPAVDPITELSATRLVVPPQGAVVREGIARFKREPLFGLHNRDYPSLWAAMRLAELTVSEPIPAPQYFERVTRDAWRFGQSLMALEKQSKTKLTALFPTNLNKPQSAKEGFRSFAIGTIARRAGDDGKFDTAGPLFQWGVAQIVKPNGTPRIGLTTAGWNLLRSLDGIELAWPHSPKHARIFFAYLKEQAPWDWAGFVQLLSAISEKPNRAELASHFQGWQPNWSPAVANTNASGLVARGREWGLVASKLVDGRYALTEFGTEIMSEEATS